MQTQTPPNKRATSFDPDQLRSQNPFALPEDGELPRRKQEMIRNTSLKNASRFLTQRSNWRKLTHIAPEPISNEEKALEKLILAPETYQEEEGIHEFIEQKREIFLAQLSIDTKKEELRRLARHEREEEETLREKAQEIQEFQDQFSKYLQNDAKETLLARQAAEAKSKERIEISLQIKQVAAKISTLRNEIAHNEEKKDENQKLKNFLDELTPEEWKETHKGEMYFTEPQQLLEKIKALEDENLFLIRHCQDAEEVVERVRDKFTQLMGERDSVLLRQLTLEHKREGELRESREFNNLFKIKDQFRHGNEIPKQEYDALYKIVREFHTQLGYEASGMVDLTLMLQRIEMRTEDVIQKINQCNLKDVLIRASKLDKDRREKEKIENQKLEQQRQKEKTDRAIAQAQLPIFRRTGRPLLKRSLPAKGESRDEKELKELEKQRQLEADRQLLYGIIWD